MKIPVASRYGSHLQQLACYRKFASLGPVQASIEPHPEVQGVYTLTLNRPEAKNSLGHQLMKQLRDSLQAFKHQQACCLLINSAVEGTFCAGADLKVYLLRNRLLLLPSQTHQRESISAKPFRLVFYRNEQQCPQRKVESSSEACAPLSVLLRYRSNGVHSCCTGQRNTNHISQCSSSSACMPAGPCCSLTRYSEL